MTTQIGSKLPVSFGTKITTELKQNWTFVSEHSVPLLFHIIYIVILFILARLLIKLLLKINHRVFSLKLNDFRHRETVEALMKSVYQYTVYVIWVFVSVRMLGINPLTVLTSAGVIGVALTLGAQNILKDTISGLFILFEDYYNVGDYVTIGSLTGYVRNIGVRVTKIEAWTGEIHTIQHGQFGYVTNYSRNDMILPLDIATSHNVDIDKAKQVLAEVLKKLEKEQSDIIETGILGVQDINASSVVIRITLKCKQLTFWAMGRAAREEIKKAFDAAGLEMCGSTEVTLINS